MFTPLLLLALQAPTVPPDSYADAATADLVARARAARDRNERLVSHYTAHVSQRIGVGLRALSRDRMLYRQELAARISWRRDAPSTIEVLGAREGVPVATRGDGIPEDLDSAVRQLVVNPAEDYLGIMGGSSDGFVYPLKAGAESDYRYRVGDTTRIELPTGSIVRLVELRITPRRADWQLMSGSLWFDADTYGLVRAVFRPARPYEWRRDADPSDREDVPGWVTASAEIRFVTMEYGLYEGRWWMLRYVALEGVGTMGRWLGVPVRFERVYTDYEVEGGTPPPAGSTFRPAGTRRGPDRRQDPDSARVEPDSAARRQRADSLRAARDACIAAEVAAHRRADQSDESGRRARRDWSAECQRRVRGDTALAVVLPDDRSILLDSPHLGPPILAMGDLVTEAEIRGLAESIRSLPVVPLGRRLELPHGLGEALARARYNRVEGLAPSLRARGSWGAWSLEAIGRVGLADWRPGGSLAFGWTGRSTLWQLEGYRGLAAANPDTRPLSALNSLSALLLQRDDGEYYRSEGVALAGQAGDGGWLTWRGYFERQRPAAVETQVSLPRLFDSEARFRPNILADRADQAGGEVALRAGRPVSRSLWIGGDATVDAATGEYEFGRLRGTLRALLTPDTKWALAMEAAAGISTGRVPVQGRFYLGGPATLRGYDGGARSGEAFWRARLEVGNSLPAARLTGFADLGWAGPRGQFATGRPFLGAGIGASFFDGLVRLDLARAMHGPTGWRFDLYFDGRL